MKMEEEKSDEDFVKKMKKLKKGQISLPEHKSLAVNAKSPAGVIKKENKKAKKDDSVVIDLEEESWNGSGKMKEKKKKGKKKNDTESLNDGKSENDEEVSKKKRKKQTVSENQVETVPISIKGEEMEKKKRKEKKVENKSVQIKSASIKIEKEEEEEQQAGKHKLPKKGKKKKKDTLAVSTEESKEQVFEKKKKKKKKKTPNEETRVEEEDDISVTKKKNKSVTEVSEKQVSLETEAVEVEKVWLKGVKKGSKKRLKERRVQKEVGTPQIEGKSEMDSVEKDNLLNKKKDISTEREIVNTEEGEMKLKRKRKKEKGRRAAAELSEIEETEPKKKKKKKVNTKGEEEEPLTLKCEEVEEQIKETHLTVSMDSTSKKRKKSSTKGGTQMKNVSFETDAKKKMKEEVEDQHETPQVDVVFLSEKSGNIDEVTINQERRQALQMEVDQASKPQTPARPGVFGQWSTVQFDSSDQQQKFLRLMGGFKKGFQQASGSTGRANMALGKDAQQQLQQGLLGEFERAQSRRVDFNNRGAGLGFTTPSNKKFSIDINACRSVHFDY